VVTPESIGIEPDRSLLVQEFAQVTDHLVGAVAAQLRRQTGAVNANYPAEVTGSASLGAGDGIHEHGAACGLEGKCFGGSKEGVRRWFPAQLIPRRNEAVDP